MVIEIGSTLGFTIFSCIMLISVVHLFGKFLD